MRFVFPQLQECYNYNVCSRRDSILSPPVILNKIEFVISSILHTESSCDSSVALKGTLKRVC